MRECQKMSASRSTVALSNYRPKKRHVVAGRPIALCVRERLCTATMGRGGSHSTYHTVGWASTNGEALLMERMNTASVSRDVRTVKIYI